MTTARRVAALEADNDATERVVRWLDEAHAFGGLDAYTEHALQKGLEAFPLVRLPREAMAAIRGRRGSSRRDVEDEVQEALRSLLFRLHLCITITKSTLAILDRESLLDGYLSTHLALAMTVKASGDDHFIGIDKLRDLMLHRVGELAALQAAREQAEVRFLGGHPVLFPDDARRWVEQVGVSQRSAVVAVSVAELDGLPDATDDGLPSPDRISQYLEDLVEMARIETLEDLDEGPAALRRMRAWYRPRESAASSPPVSA